MSNLKPHIDSIFEDVLQRLPTIDFDLSDVSSDSDEPIVFRRNLKVFDLDYDEDTSENFGRELNFINKFAEKPGGDVDVEDTYKVNEGYEYDNRAEYRETEKTVNGGVRADDLLDSVRYSTDSDDKKSDLVENCELEGDLSHSFELISDSEIGTLNVGYPRGYVVAMGAAASNNTREDESSIRYQGVLETTKDNGIQMRSAGVGTCSDEDAEYIRDSCFIELSSTGTGLASRYGQSEESIFRSPSMSKGTGDKESVTSWADIQISEVNNNKLDLSPQDRRKNRVNLNRHQRNVTYSGIKIESCIARDEDGRTGHDESNNTICDLDNPGNKDVNAGKYTKEAGMKSAATKDDLDSYISMPAPKLSFEKLENIDLDSVYKSLVVNGRMTENIGDTRSRMFTPFETSSENDHMTMIQRLSQLASQQSGVDLGEVNPVTGAWCGQLSKAEIEKATTPSELMVQGTQSDVAARDKTELPKESPFAATSETKKLVHTDTIFLDLRDFEEKRRVQEESIARVQRVLGITPHSTGMESESEDDENWYMEQRRLIKSGAAITLGMERKKKQLKLTRPTVKPPTRVIDLSKVNCVKKNTTTANQITPSTSSTNQILASSAGTATVKPDNHGTHKRQHVEAERERKLREERRRDFESRARLMTQMTNLRSTASVGGRLPAAEATPIVYDMEVSYEPQLSTLPSLSDDSQLLLLTVCLSTCGEILLHKANKHLSSGPGLSATYTSLLVWLCSLIPQNFDFLFTRVSSDFEDSRATFNQPPFRVLGFQQLMLDGELRLLVAIAPPNQCASRSLSNRTRKTKTKSSMKDCSPFMRDVSRFLTTHNLHSVCPFLDDIISVDISSTNDDSSKFVYRSPVPDVTEKTLSSYVQISPDVGAARKLFSKDVSFVWQTADTGEHLFEQSLFDAGVTYDVQSTMSLVYRKIYGDSYALLGVFHRILQLGLDLSGIRLLYPTPEVLRLSSSSHASHPEPQTPRDILTNVGPILAVALHGAFARPKWLEAVGPSDPALARKTDPNSLSALYGGETRDENMLYFPRNPARTASELTRWFGGRVKNAGDCIDVGVPYVRAESRLNSRRGRVLESDADELPLPRPPAALTATVKGQIIVVVRPVVAARCTGLIVRVCQRRGYHVRGMRRLAMSQARATTLGIQSHLDGEMLGVAHTLMLLEAENAWHNSASLLQDVLVQMCLDGIAGELQKELSHPLTANDLFHVTSLSPAMLASICPDFTKCPEQTGCMLSLHRPIALHSNPDCEQIVVLVVTGHETLKASGLILDELLCAGSTRKSSDAEFRGFELLGIKWLATLTMAQAYEVTPYELGERNWRGSIHTLVNQPALVVVLRGVNAFKRLDARLKAEPSIKRSKSPIMQDIMNPNKIMSQTPEQAHQFVSLFFYDCELVADNSVRYTLDYFPSSLYRSEKPRGKDNQRDSIVSSMLTGPLYITSFLLVKPSAVRRHLSAILRKLAQEKLRVVALRMVQLDTVDAHYFDTPEMITNKQLCEESHAHLVSAPSVVIVIRGENCVKKLLDLLGPHDPMTARRRSQFLWRGVFGSSAAANALHASATYKNALADQARFFNGLCTNEASLQKLTQLPCPHIDDVINKDRHVVHNESQSDPFRQTTCIVLPPVLFESTTPAGRPAYIDIVDSLMAHGFSVVGARLIWMTSTHAASFVATLTDLHLSVKSLVTAPTLVLAAQRDNAILTFDSLLSRSTHGDSVVTKYGTHMIRAQSVTQADSMLAYFFDVLYDDGRTEIQMKNTNATQNI